MSCSGKSWGRCLIYTSVLISLLFCFHDYWFQQVSDSIFFADRESGFLIWCGGALAAIFQFSGHGGCDSCYAMLYSSPGTWGFIASFRHFLVNSEIDTKIRCCFYPDMQGSVPLPNSYVISAYVVDAFEQPSTTCVAGIRLALESDEFFYAAKVAFDGVAQDEVLRAQNTKDRGCCGKTATESELLQPIYFYIFFTLLINTIVLLLAAKILFLLIQFIIDTIQKFSDEILFSISLWQLVSNLSALICLSNLNNFLNNLVCDSLSECSRLPSRQTVDNRKHIGESRLSILCKAVFFVLLLYPSYKMLFVDGFRCFGTHNVILWITLVNVLMHIFRNIGRVSWFENPETCAVLGQQCDLADVASETSEHCDGIFSDSIFILQHFDQEQRIGMDLSYTRIRDVPDDVSYDNLGSFAHYTDLYANCEENREIPGTELVVGIIAEAERSVLGIESICNHACVYVNRV